MMMMSLWHPVPLVSVERKMAVSHLFDQFRKAGNDVLRSARDTIDTTFEVSGLGKFSRYSDVPKDDFKASLKVLLGQELYECLTGEQVGRILQELTRSLRKVDKETTVACLKYWLREDVKPITALILVDVQNDFISGSLALKNCPAGQDGCQVVPVINELLSKKLFDHIAYTKDWHPSDHCSYIDNVKLHPIHSSSPVDAEHAKIFDKVVFDYVPLVEQTMWPRHCEINSQGAELHKDLQPPNEADIVVTKGSNSKVDSYSGFWDNKALSNTELFVKLVERDVTHVFVCGLALDVCVQFTALDAADHGFRTFVIEDACQGVSNEGIAVTKRKFAEIGATLVKACDVTKTLKALE